MPLDEMVREPGRFTKDPSDTLQIHKIKRKFKIDLIQKSMSTSQKGTNFEVTLMFRLTELNSTPVRDSAWLVTTVTCTYKPVKRATKIPTNPSIGFTTYTDVRKCASNFRILSSCYFIHVRWEGFFYFQSCRYHKFYV